MLAFQSYALLHSPLESANNYNYGDDVLCVLLLQCLFTTLPCSFSPTGAVPPGNGGNFDWQAHFHGILASRERERDHQGLIINK